MDADAAKYWFQDEVYNDYLRENPDLGIKINFIEISYSNEFGETNYPAESNSNVDVLIDQCMNLLIDDGKCKIKYDAVKGNR